MKFTGCCILAAVCSASRSGPGIPKGPGQDMVEMIDFEPIEGGPMDVMLGAPGPSKKGKSPSGLSEKELDDVLADMLGPQNTPQRSGPRNLPGGSRNVPSDMNGMPDGAEVVMGNGRNGLPDGAVVEIDGPPPQSEQEMDELLAALTGRPEPRPASRQGKKGPRTDAPPNDEVIMGNGRNGLPEGVEVEIVGDEPPPEMNMMLGPGSPGVPEEIPIEALKQLFPPGQMIIEEDDGPGPPRKTPTGEDAIISELMSEMDQAMREQMMPMAERSAEENLPSTCSKEIKAHCKGAKSQLHCLGKHTADISDQCRADVGKAVPFLCSDAIDQYCDVLMGGILSCLGNQMNHLEGSCKDAVLATRTMIKKVNSQKATQATPKAKAISSAREAHLDAKLIGLQSSATPAKPAAKAAAKPVAKAKPPAVLPELQEKLMDHDMRPTQHSESPQASPPFFAWFVPLCILSAGAVAVHKYWESMPNAKTYSHHEEKETLCQRPIKTSSGMELLTPGGRYDLEI